MTKTAVTVKKIEIMGKEYPIKVGYYALSKSLEEKQAAGDEDATLLNMLSGSGSFAVMESILFYSLELGAILTDSEKEFKLERKKAAIYLDCCFAEFPSLMQMAFSALTESIKEEGKEPKEKKLKAPKSA